MIKEKVKVNLCGKMEEFMMVFGKMVNNMEKENSLQKKVLRELVNGITEERLDG
jgi:hypothetical protein